MEKDKKLGEILVIGSGGSTLQAAEAVARLNAMGHKDIQVVEGQTDVFLFQGAEYRIARTPDMNDQDIIDKLLTLQQKSIWEQKEIENSKCLIQEHGDNDLYGYRKPRQGSNKKYIKRKKAKNGKTKKRRK